MSAQAYADRLARAFELTGLFEPVRSSFRPDQIVVLGRVQKHNQARWIDLVERLELAMETCQGQPMQWQSHFCQRYFLKEMDTGHKKIVYAWNISIQSTNMGDTLDAIMRVIKGEQLKVAAPGELQEMEMTGLTGERGVPNAKGKGAYHIGSEDGKKDFRPMVGGR